MNIPIGLIHLSKHLPLVLAPAIVLDRALVYGSSYYNPAFTLSLPIRICISILSILLLFLASSLWADLSNRRAAAACGAVSPPVVKDVWGGLANMKALVKNIESGYPGDVNHDWCKKYGNTFHIKLLSEKRVVTTEPEHIKALLATQFNDFEKGPILFKQFHALLGTGVFNSDGDMWKFHRSMTRPFFSKERISHFDVFDRHAEDALNQGKARLQEGYPIDFQDMVSRFTLDSASEFLFGKDLRSLSAGLPYPASVHHGKNEAMACHPANVFADAFIRSQILTAFRNQYGRNWPVFEWTDQIKPLRKIVNQTIDPLIESAIAKQKATNKSEVNQDEEVKEGDTLLDHLVQVTEDHQIIQDEILNIMLASRDTTASTLTFCVYMLAENPHVLVRLRDEILTRIGQTRRPTFDDMREMKYLRAFINETLRLYPPVPFNSRTTNRATTWPAIQPGGKPIYLPARTRAVYSVFLMHRREDLWGPDALVFDPERFLDKRVKKYIVPNPFIFLPFNAGPRICLGQQFAYHEISFFLVRLLQRFSSFSLAEDAQPAWSKPPANWAECGGRKATEKIMPGTHVTMYVKGGLWVRMGEANTVDMV